MKRFFCFFLMLGSVLITEAQNTITAPNLGDLPLWSPERNRNNRKTEGSPFLLKQFANATIYLDRNKAIANIPANLDLENNEIVVLDEKKKLFAISVPVYRVVFEDETTGQERTVLSGLPAIDKQTEKSYYELLHPGKTNLLKVITLYWSESRAYHEAVPTRKYEQSPTYYIYNDSRGMIKLPKSPQDIPVAINAQQAGKLSKLVQEHQLNLKTEIDLIKLMDLYNTSDY
jgi:hypothetical protein